MQVCCTPHSPKRIGLVSPQTIGFCLHHHQRDCQERPPSPPPALLLLSPSVDGVGIRRQTQTAAAFPGPRCQRWQHLAAWQARGSCAVPCRAVPAMVLLLWAHGSHRGRRVTPAKGQGLLGTAATVGSGAVSRPCFFFVLFGGVSCNLTSLC